jgi:hypothetical protein
MNPFQEMRNNHAVRYAPSPSPFPPQ